MVITVDLEKRLRIKMNDAYKQIGGYTAFSNRLIFSRLTFRKIIQKSNEIHCVENELRIGRRLLISGRMERKSFLS